MSEIVKMLRHLEEENTFQNGVRDGRILDSEKYRIESHYAPDIVNAARRKNIGDVRLISSTTRRTLDTAAMIKGSIEERSDMHVLIETDPRIKALQHGQYYAGIDADHSSVKRAQAIYIRETFGLSNPWYRHGDPLLQKNGKYRYPELVDIFQQPGENQVEVSIRLYASILDLLKRKGEMKNELFVLSTHYVVLSRLLSLQYIAGCVQSDQLRQRKVGKLYQMEWDVSDKVMAGCEYKEFFRQHNFIFDLDIDKMGVVQEIVQEDLDMLLYNYKEKREQGFN